MEKVAARLTSQELSNFSAALVSRFRRFGLRRLLPLPLLFFLRLELLTIPAFAAGAQRKEGKKKGRKEGPAVGEARHRGS